MGFFFLRYTKPIYRSNSIVQLIQDDKTSQVLGTASLVEDKGMLSKEIELLRSDVLFSRAIKKLNLETSIFAEGEILTKDLYRTAPFEIIVYNLNDSSLIEKPIDITMDSQGNIILLSEDVKLVSGPLNSHLKNNLFDIYIRALNKTTVIKMLSEDKIYFKINNREDLLRKFKDFLKIDLVDNNAKTIEISYEYYNPRLCFDIVDGVLKEYLDWERDSKQTAANKTLKFIDLQLDSLSRVLRKSKDSLNNYQKRVKILNPDVYGEQLSTNINTLTDKVLGIDEELYTVRIIHQKIKNNPNRLEIYRLIPEMIGKKSFQGTVLKQIEDLNTILEQKDDLLREVTNENVQVVILNERLKNRVSSIHKSMDVIEERLLNERELLKNKINEEEKTYFGLPEKKIEY
jgi:capsule polysaccharide export protein KpsE/RkpR